MKLCLIALLLWGPLNALAQPLPFLDDFNDGDYNGWNVTDDPEPQSGPSQWVVENGVLIQKSNIWAYGPVELETKYHLGTHITTGDKNWTDYSLNALVRSTDNDGVGLIFRYEDARHYYRVLLMNDPSWSGRDSAGTPVNTPLQRIQKFVNGEPFILAENKVSQAYPSGFFTLTADVRGDTIKAYLNGELILSAIDPTYDTGKIGLLSYANSGAYYDSVSVTETPLVYDKPDESSIVYSVREDRAPYVQNPTQTSVEIAWRSLTPAIGSVKYDTEKGRLSNEVVEPGPRQKHHLKLFGLEPSTRYFYAVYEDGTEKYQEENFRTGRKEEETEFSFLVLGDSGVDTPTQYKVADEMRHNMNQKEVDFVLHVGDVHQGIGDYYDDVYFKPYRSLLKNVNIFTSLGNHDVITDNGGVYLDDFYLPNNNPDSTERYYSFRWANAYFIALDTNIDYSPGSPQYNFLLDALNAEQRKSATWTFVYSHHPPYSEHWTNYFGEQRVQDHLVPLYEQYDVDMVLNGHTHSYERGEREHVHYLVSGGGGGTLDDFFVDYDHIAFSSKSHHFTRIDVDGDELVVSATNENGQEIDRFVIHKFTEVAVDETSPQPALFHLHQNYPNPVSGSTSIRYDVPTAGRVTLELVDVVGHRIATLVDRHHPAGSYTVTLNASTLAAGTYLYSLKTINKVITKEMTIIR